MGKRNGSGFGGGFVSGMVGGMAMAKRFKDALAEHEANKIAAAKLKPLEAPAAKIEPTEKLGDEPIAQTAPVSDSVVEEKPLALSDEYKDEWNKQAEAAPDVSASINPPVELPPVQLSAGG